MRAFVPKPESTRSLLPRPSWAGQSRDPNPLLTLQRTTANRAVQEILRGEAGGGPAAPGLSGVAVSVPGDPSELEAERIADQVMRMPEPQLPPVDARGEECAPWRPEVVGVGIGRVRSRAGGEGEASVPPLVREVLRSPGRPLDPAVRASMEERFGHDFGRVRVHDGEMAAESARSINALAYTNGTDIVFGAGQYRPATEEGRRLLAHELVHTLQGEDNVLQRKIEFTQPTPIPADPIPLVLGGRSILGSTLPSLNGTVLPGYAIKKDYKEAVFNALQPQAFTFSDTRGGKTCKVSPDNFKITVSAEVRVIKEPDHGKWAGLYPPATLGSPPTVCAGKREAIAVEMKGKPDSAALCTKVRSHEQEHVTDLKNFVNSELKPYHDFLVGLTSTGKSEKECVDNLFSQVGKKDAEAAGKFVDKWLDAVQVYDKPGGTHHSKFETTVDAGCTTMRIEEKL